MEVKQVLQLKPPTERYSTKS